MAERDLTLDCRGRPWRDLPDVVRCGACLGALPPNDPAACSTCGTGAPPVHPPVTLLIEEHNLTEEEMVEVAGPASARLTWWERFARWPNHG